MYFPHCAISESISTCSSATTFVHYSASALASIFLQMMVAVVYSGGNAQQNAALCTTVATSIAVATALFSGPPKNHPVPLVLRQLNFLFYTGSYTQLTLL